MTRMIERWFPCQEVSENSESGWGSGNSEANLFTWFAERPLVQAKAAVMCSLLPWPDDESEQARLQKLVRTALTDRDAAQAELVDELAKSFPMGATMLDPFSGRGMIPLEAARLGVKAWGIDYSPVANLAGTLLADYPMRDWANEPTIPFGGYDSGDLATWGTTRLVRDVEAVLHVIGDRYESAMDAFYPLVDGKRPWGYLWAVTLPCENCGRTFPLTGNLVLRHPLAKKSDPGQSYRILTEPETGTFTVDVHDGAPSGNPTLASVKDQRGKVAICPFCEHVHIKDVHTRMMNDHLSGDALLLVADIDDDVGKRFRAPTSAERTVIDTARDALAEEKPFGLVLPAVPDERVPPGNNDTVRPSLYGYRTYGEFCNDRQTLGFVRLARIINDVSAELLAAGVSQDYTAALAGYAAAVVVKKFRRSTRGADLGPRKDPRSNRVDVGDIFTNEASIAFSYDYFEPGCGAGPGTWESLAPQVVAALRNQCARVSGRPGLLRRGSALALPMSDASIDAVVTDPPYDSMIDYTDASDLFYVWLKRALVTSNPEFGITAHPLGVQEKDEEVIVKRGGKSVDDFRTDEHYDRCVATAFTQARRKITDDGVVTIVFGHGDPDVWHRLLGSITAAGLVLTGSWPARTEKGGKAGSANIETTLTLACRPAATNRRSGRVTDVDAEVRREIVARIPLWDTAGLALTDQLMASAGPAMEVVGRYSEVLDKTGNQVDLDRYLPLARRFVEEAADIKVDTLPLETFDIRTRFALFWIRIYGRGIAPASEARWHRLASDLTDDDTVGLHMKDGKGVRLAYASEANLEVSAESPAIDVALAVAEAGKSVAEVADVLVRTGRIEDPFVWAAMGELARLVPEADRDGDAWTWVVRNRAPITGASRNVEAARTREEQEAEQAASQGSLFGGED